MKLTVFGASGRTGRAAVETAIARGHDVTAVVRDANAAADLGPAVQMAIAQVTSDADAVASAVAGRDAVIVALGPKSPFDRSVLTDAMANIVPAMEATTARRLVVLSALGLSPAMRSPVLLRLVGLTLLRRVAADKRDSEALIGTSNLDWTLVLPGPLTDRPRRGQLHAIPRPAGLARSSRRDVGKILVALAEHEGDAQAVTVAYQAIESQLAL